MPWGPCVPSRPGWNERKRDTVLALDSALAWDRCLCERLPEPQFPFLKNWFDNDSSLLEPAHKLIVEVSGILELVVKQSSLKIKLCKHTIK